MIDNNEVERLGDALHEALLSGRPAEKISTLWPESTIEDAYRIQSHLLARRIAAGDEVIGKKIGLTSRAIQDALGVYQPDFGQITRQMLHQDQDVIDLGRLMQPRAEAELAFILKRDLVGPGITQVDVIRATDYVCPCFEIVDTRFSDWNIRIQDTVADNASCGVFLLGAGGPIRVTSISGWPVSSSKKTARCTQQGSGRRCRGLPPMPWPGSPTRSAGTALR